jgi:hypothetical protein
MNNEDIQTLKEWALSTFVQKDACSDRHEKTDEKINNLMIEQGKMGTKLSLILWVGGTAAAASIGSILTSLYGVIFK